MYYRLAGEAVSLKLMDEILAAARSADTVLNQDRRRMTEVRHRRERYALTAATGPRQWAQPQGDRPSEPALRQALEEALGAGPLGEVLDVGTGSGTLLRLVGSRASAAVGLDTSRGMRVLARSRLQQAGLAHCTIRAGDMHALPFPDHAFDVVILDDVLALSRRPLEALGEAVRVLRPAGRVVILDRILPAVRRLPAQSRDGSLFENQLGAMLRGAGLRLTHRTWFPGRSLEHALFTAAVRPAPARTGTDG
jgi:ArsR family transcriptional regulator